MNKLITKTNPLIPPSIRALKLHGVPKSSAKYVMYNHWKIEDVTYLPIFETYYLLKWEAYYFIKELKEGILETYEQTYQVIYYRTTPAEIINHKGDILLSFRALKEAYACTPTVLVTLDLKGRK